MNKYLIPIFLILNENVWARSIKATADKLGSETKNIGISLGGVGLIIAGIYLALGKQDASTKVTQAILGMFVIMISSNVVGFIKGVV